MDRIPFNKPCKELLPVTEHLASRLLRLPCYFELGEAEQDRVIDAFLDLVEG